LFWVVSRLVDGFTVASFGWAIIAAIVYSLVSWAVSSLVMGSKDGLAPSMKPILPGLALALALAAPLPARAADPAPNSLAFSAVVRLGYLSREREDRDGARSD